MASTGTRFVAGALLSVVVCSGLGWQSAAKPSVVTLSNGATLIVREDHTAAIVSIAILVRAGSSRETRENSGCAHLIEHLAFRGTTNHPNDQLTAAAEKLGYKLEAKTEKELTTFTCTCLSGEWKEVFGLLADAVVNLAPSKGAFRDEQRVTVQECFAHRDNPVEFIQDRLFQLAYGDSGYGLTTGGTVEGLQKVTLDSIQLFRKDWYTTGNTFIAVVGDVSAGKVKEEAESWFGAMPRSTGMTFATPAQSQPRNVDEKGIYTRAAVALAFPAPGSTGHIADTAVLDALDVLLEARLGSAEALRGAVLASNVQYLTLSQPTLATVVVFCDEAKLTAVSQGVADEIKRVADGKFTEAEFVAARNKALALDLYEVETCAGLAHALGYWAASAGPAAYDAYAKALPSATYADAKRVAAEVYDSAKQIKLVWHAGGEGGK